MELKNKLLMSGLVAIIAVSGLITIKYIIRLSPTDNVPTYSESETVKSNKISQEEMDKIKKSLEPTKKIEFTREQLNKMEKELSPKSSSTLSDKEMEKLFKSLEPNN